MPKNYRKLNVPFFALCSGTLLAIGVWASTQTLLLPSKASQRLSPQAKVNRISKTDALEVVNTSETNGFVKVSLKNVSTKTIDGIQLSINGGYLQIDFLGADEEDYQRLLPGAVYEQFLPRRDISQPLDVRVLAVTFDDKSSDGDPILAREILDTRRGFNRQLKRIRPLLEAALSSPESDSVRILDRLKSQVEGLPSEESTDSSAIKAGHRQARAEVIDQIEFLKQRQLATGALPIRLALAKMKNRHDKRIQYGLE